MGQLRKLISLPATERRLLLGAVGLVVIARLSLGLLPLRVLRRLLVWYAQRLRGLATLPAARVAWAIGVAGDSVPAATCLVRALAAEALLGRVGQPALLRIGVSRDAEGGFHAHAWVESAGTLVTGGTAEYVAQFTPLPGLEGALR